MTWGHYGRLAAARAGRSLARDERDRERVRARVARVRMSLHDRDVPEADVTKPREVLGQQSRAADARAGEALVAAYALGRRGREDDVTQHEPAARPQHAPGLGEGLPLVVDEIDDAVGHDHVETPVREREVSDVAELEAHVRATIRGTGRPLDHLRRHVDALDAALGAHELGGAQCVLAAAGAEVEDAFAGTQPGRAHDVARAEREGLTSAAAAPRTGQLSVVPHDGVAVRHYMVSFSPEMR